MDIEKDLFEIIGPKAVIEDDSNNSSLSYWGDVFRRLKNNKIAITCLSVILIMIIGSIIIPLVSSYSISEQNLEGTNLSFFKEGHIFGTDNLGRDNFIRVWFGCRVSLIIAFSAVFINLIVGTIYGGISGYMGGRTDEVMMRLVDIMIAIPQLIIVMLLMIVLKPGITTIIIAYATVGWTGMARLVRGQVIKLKNSEYVLASQLLGASTARIILKDLLPNTIGVIIVNLTLTIPNAIFTEAFLSYIGLGVQIPLASLGTLVSYGSSSFRLYPHLLIVPASFMCALMLAFNLLGDSLRDIVDPKMKK